MTQKETILKTAARLFAAQGFDATSTLQIAREAGVSEPLINYHFKGKNELFTRILKSTRDKYESRLQALNWNPEHQIENINQLIHQHLDFVEQMQDTTDLFISTCPVRLDDPADISSRVVGYQHRRLFSLLEKCLAAGVESGEFYNVPVAETAGLLVAMISGLLRQRLLSLDGRKDMCRTAVDFCRRSLMKMNDEVGE